jgi:diguanylate cyclase (GGDEF)-like protein
MSSLPSSDPRVLVATAEPQLGLRHTTVLTGLRYSVQSAENGAVALDIVLGPNPPDIALLDASLPGLGGLEIAAETKRRLTRKQTWFVLLSRAADPSTIAAAADAGVDDFLLCAPGGAIDDTEFEMDLRIRLSVAARVQAITRDLEARIQAISFHSLHDTLTGLWNRESLLSLLFPETDRVQRMGTPLGLLLLDLDHFARINAEYGYEAGDKILAEFANRLRRYLRSYDLIGRCGEDEFLVALPGCNSSQTLHLANRIRTTLLHRPFAAGRDMITLAASIGVAQSRGRSPLVALREAERALTSAKLEGRNCEREYIQPRQKRERPWEEHLA